MLFPPRTLTSPFAADRPKILKPQGDRYFDVCSGCVECADCDVDDGTDVPTCTNVLDNTKSAGNSIVLETLVVDSGYWRATPSSRDILACHNPDACLGGETGAAGYCAEGYEGPCASVYLEAPKLACRRSVNSSRAFSSVQLSRAQLIALRDSLP